MARATASYSVLNVSDVRTAGQTSAGSSPVVPPTPANAEPVRLAAVASAVTTPHAAVVWGGLISVVAVTVLAWWLVPGAPEFPINPAPPLEGLTIFAVFFVGAQALERLLEPLSMYWGASAKNAADKSTHDADRSAADPQVDAATVQTKVQEAADSLGLVQRKQNDKIVSFWALATSLGVLASAVFHMYFLSTVGIAVPNVFLEILGTGLILGAGTKPLHDLVDLIEAKSNSPVSGAGS